MSGAALHPTILREYDIRGVVGETLSVEDARSIGRAFASATAEEKASPRICLGYDGRLSSPDFVAAVEDGMIAAGAEVLRIGRGPTPMLYFAVYHLDADAGLMVTGSHNPPDHNGFKMMRGPRSPKGGPVYGQAILDLGRRIAAGDFASGSGSAADAPVFDAYIDRLLRDIDLKRPLKVAWDPGNGATAETVSAVAARLPGVQRLLNATIDGTFPNHHPDPTVPANLRQLQDAVTGEGLDLGFAFDGDGDRIGVIDGGGEIIWGDQLVALLAREVLQAAPGAPIIADVKASQVLFDEIARLGGQPVMWKTGHSLIKQKMAEMKAPLAGEMSGHIFFADRFYGFDDGLYVALRFLAQVAAGTDKVADLRRSLPQPANTPELRFPCDDTEKFEKVARLDAHLRQAGADVSDVDGVRVTLDKGWWLLRASNTQPVLVARCEAEDDAALTAVRNAMIAALEAVGIDLPQEMRG
ncbi:phosphoglucomutase/phosphomannomutase PgmG [Marinibaculum pumilum]|uniref:Phosphoglucomutase/phosphomannomutase PgmG n=1 Tax=Marinibaculum pumilum TaxID=1766165 RepID=A0ABV7KZ31_9PROT